MKKLPLIDPYLLLRMEGLLVDFSTAVLLCQSSRIFIVPMMCGQKQSLPFVSLLDAPCILRFRIVSETT